MKGERRRLRLGLTPAHPHVGTQLCLKVLSGSTRHLGLLLSQVGEARGQGLGVFWSEETLKHSFWEKETNIVPSQRVFLPVALSSLFCWIISGTHWSLHSPDVPGSGVQGALKTAYAFSACPQLAVESMRSQDSAVPFA